VKKIHIFLLVGGVAVIISGCYSKKCAPEETIPVIAYKDFIVLGDSARLGITFEDCDGDIGLNEWEKEPPYDYNLFLTYIEVKGGKDTIIALDPPFYFRIPYFKSENRPLKGEIWVSLSPLFYRPGGADTIKYRIYLKDRKLHSSNVVETPPIPINKK